MMGPHEVRKWRSGGKAFDYGPFQELVARRRFGPARRAVRPVLSHKARGCAGKGTLQTRQRRGE